MAKLFADYVKEKKLREPEEKKELAQTLKTFLICRNEKERIRSMYNKTIIRFGFCDIPDITKTADLDYSHCILRIIKVRDKGHQPQSSASADNPYLDFDYSGYHKNLIQ